MRYLRTNTDTRITVGPFLDKTDGITPEVAITVTGCKLTFMVDVAGVPTLILDTAPTASGGNNDMVHVTNDDAGIYDLELTAANTNYLGRAMVIITDVATHCPVFHEFTIIPANVYDSIILGTDVLNADVTQVGGDTQSATDLKDFADAGYDPVTNKVEGVKLVDTTTTNTDMRGTNSAALASVCTETRLAELDAANLPTDVAAVKTDTAAILLDTGTDGVVLPITERNYVRIGTAQGGNINSVTLAASTDMSTNLWRGQSVTIWTGAAAEQTRGILTYNNTTKVLTVARNFEVAPTNGAIYTINVSFGPKVNNTLEVMVNDAGADLTAIPWNAAWDAEVQSECADALTAYAPSTHTAADVWAVGTRVLTAGTNIVLAKGTGITGFNDIAAADVWSVATRVLTAGTNIVLVKGTGVTGFNDITATDVLTQVDAALDTAGTELSAIPTTTGTLRQKINWVFQYFRNKKTITSTAETLKKEDASTTLGTATISDDGTTFTKGEMN